MSESSSSTPAATPDPTMMRRRSYLDAASSSEERMVAYYRPEPVALPLAAPTAAALSSLMLGLVGAMGAGYVVLAVLYLRDRAQRRTVELAESLPVVARYSDKPSVTAV